VSFGDVTLLAEGTEHGDLDGLALTLDGRGIVVDAPAAGAGPRVLPWSSVTEWWVSPSPSGTLLSVHGAQGSFRFLVVDADPSSLVTHIEALARLGGDGSPRPDAPSARREVQAARRARGRGTRRRRSWWRVALAVALVVVLVTGVALVLAQSAGLVHLPFLGPTTGVDSAVTGARGAA